MFLQSATMSSGDLLAGSGIAAFILGLGLVALLVFAAIYVFVALALMGIAKKTKTDNAWMAWIPVLNFYLVTQMAGVSGWWTLAILFPIVPWLGQLALTIVGIWMFWRIAERIKFPGWTSLLMLIPIVNLIVLGIYAWHE